LIRQHLIFFFGATYGCKFTKGENTFGESMDYVNEILIEMLQDKLTDEELNTLHDCIDEVWLLYKKAGYTNKEMKGLNLSTRS